MSAGLRVAQTNYLSKKMTDYLDLYKDEIDCEAIRELRKEPTRILNSKGNKPLVDLIEQMPDYQFTDNDFSQKAVRFGQADSLSDEKRAQLKEQLKQLIPWRKGPFDIAGIEMDTEWRSDYKWDMLEGYLPNMKGQRICDIGANSGYYMYRMLADDPEFILGMDPTIKYYLQFQALQKLTAPNCLHYEAIGMEHLVHYPTFFDTIFCMGILYHHPDPVGMLRVINQSMKPGGDLIIESQAIPGDDHVALFPDETYALVKGTYFVPTANCLINWLKKAKFVDIEFFKSHPMSSNDQRKTEWMPFRSYEDFVDEETGLTVEGYPAPIRIYLRAKKKA